MCAIVLSDPAAFIERLTTSLGPTVGKKLAIAKLAPLLKPLLAKQNLAWADVVPALDAVDSLDELTGALTGLSMPQFFLSPTLLARAARVFVRMHHIAACIGATRGCAGGRD